MMSDILFCLLMLSPGLVFGLIALCKYKNGLGLIAIVLSIVNLGLIIGISIFIVSVKLQSTGVYNVPNF
jgi:disulfide bond formation protein DsbB